MAIAFWSVAISALAGCATAYDPGQEIAAIGEYDPLSNFDFDHDPNYLGGETTGSPLERGLEKMER